MRAFSNIFWLAIAAIVFLAPLASAEGFQSTQEGPSNNTTNMYFIVLFKMSDFDNGDNEEQINFSFSFDGTNESSPQILVMNIADVMLAEGGDDVGDVFLSFSNVDLSGMDLPFDLEEDELMFFGFGNASDPALSEHMLFSANPDEDPADIATPEENGVEEDIIDGSMNMDELDPALMDPGGAAIVTAQQLADQLGLPIDAIIDPETGEINWEAVNAFMGTGEDQVLGFTQATFIQNNVYEFSNGQFISAMPEPSLAALALVGVGMVFWRRRRKTV